MRVNLLYHCQKIELTCQIHVEEKTNKINNIIIFGFCKVLSGKSEPRLTSILYLVTLLLGTVGTQYRHSFLSLGSKSLAGLQHVQQLSIVNL